MMKDEFVKINYEEVLNIIQECKKEVELLSNKYGQLEMTKLSKKINLLDIKFSTLSSLNKE